MSTGAGFAERADAARRRLREVAATGPGVFGAPDPKTGEAWNAGNVLGHLAEVMEFWPAQLRHALEAPEGPVVVGRDEAAYARRLEAIAEGVRLPESELRARIEAGVDALLPVLARAPDAAFGRAVTQRSPQGSREITLGGFVEDLLVGHLEAHVRQLEELHAAR